MPKLAPNFADFERAAALGNIVPVYSERLGDLSTPVGEMLKVVGRMRRPFLLESAEGGEHVGRYSFLGGDPFLELVGDADGLEVRRPGREPRRLDGNPVGQLAAIQASFRAAPVAPGGPPFSGGGVGYLGYDAIRWIERVPNRNPADPQLPWLYLAYYDRLIAFDHLRHRILLVANARIDDPHDRGGLRAAYSRAHEQIDELAAVLDGEPLDAAPLDAVDLPEHTTLETQCNIADADFCAAVESARDYIAAGDAFQIVLSRRLACQTQADPLTVYRALRAVNPSPYMFCLDTGTAHIVGSSPEMLVRLEECWIENRPIAGTRRRDVNPKVDAALAAQLLADEKERAEHLMLVDLGRNDIGRVAEYGTVTVPQFMTVERYSHVMHLVSSVRGKLREGVSPAEALFASFPAGTVSGAPKIRAMEIIDELEPTARGVYAGAILYADFSGNLDSCIAIRTIVMKGTTAYVQVGAGIVADSSPRRELAETSEKAAASLQALEWAEAAAAVRAASDKEEEE